MPGKRKSNLSRSSNRARAMKARRAQEAYIQTNLRRLEKAERQAIYRSSETPEQSQLRRHRHAKYMALRRAAIKAAQRRQTFARNTKNYTFHVESMHRDYKTRNILSLEERVQVIRDYEQNPVYQRIAEKYNCSSKQIKNILNNKEAVLLYHANRMADGSTTNERRQRQQKIAFLGKVIYEYIQRAVYHGFHLNVANVRQKALEVKESIAIMNFYPNNAWMQNFKMQYNIPEFELMTLRQSMFLSEAKEESFKAVDIIQYMSQREKQLEKMQLQHQRMNGNFDDSYNNDQNEALDEYGEPTVTYEHENDDDINDYAEDNVQLNSLSHENSNQSSAHLYGKRGATSSSNGIVDLLDDDDLDNTKLNPPMKRQKFNSSTIHLPEINNPQEALRYLKVLEDYAMLGENYRAIGLIEQLEQVFKNPPKSEDFVA